MIRSLAIVVVAVALSTACDAGKAPAATDAWVRAMPAERKMTAAYLVIDNPTDETLVVTGATAAGFARVELHTSIEEDGVSRMRPVETIDVEPGGSVRLAPGGLHMMLMGAREPISAGDTIALTLTTDTHGELAVAAPVTLQAPAVD